MLLRGQPSFFAVVCTLFCCHARAALPPIDPTRLVADARAQIGVTTSYDPTYRRLAYPNGDVPADKGVCTDVVVRALRKQSADLQQLVHEDMRVRFAKYPKLWGLKAPDKNIDHRRVPNLCTYFSHAGKEVPVTRSAADYAPGDVVAWELTPAGATTPHIGIVSDKRSPEGIPLIIHNIGSGVREEDVLFKFKITGHFRLGPAK